MPRFHPSRRTIPGEFVLLGVLLACCAATGSPVLASPEPRVSRNLGTEIAPDSTTALALEASLNGFLAETYAREYSDRYVDPAHHKRNEFFFDNLPTGVSRNESTSFDEPMIVRSYSPNERDYYVTLSFSGKRDDQPFLYKIVELKAVPVADHFRFHCLFDERTANLETESIGDVTFYHEGDLDREKAREFVEFKRRFAGLTRTESEPLHYYKFRTLQNLLEAHGILFDAAKCNFLCNDLGITDNEGKKFATGMNNECYIRDYIHGHFFQRMDHVDELYRPFREGMAIYYGGTWGGVRLPEMIQRFREEMLPRPGVDFLEEFKKGRKSSVRPHFSFFFLSALLCREVIEQHGFEEALQLVYSGSEGERFFANLDDVLGVDESNFHDTIVRLMEEPTLDRRGR